MSIRAVDKTCMRCGKPLRASKLDFVGDCCAKRYTPEQLEAMAVYAAQAADPFHIPAPLRTLSAEGQRNNRDVHAAISVAAVRLCRHENRVGACPDCRREADPTRAAERILREVLATAFADRCTERARVVAVRWAHVPAWTPPEPLPAARTASIPPRDRRRRHARPTGQLELL